MVPYDQPEAALVSDGIASVQVHFAYIVAQDMMTRWIMDIPLTLDVTKAAAPFMPFGGI